MEEEEEKNVDNILLGEEGRTEGQSDNNDW